MEEPRLICEQCGTEYTKQEIVTRHGKHSGIYKQNLCSARCYVRITFKFPNENKNNRK